MHHKSAPAGEIPAITVTSLTVALCGRIFVATEASQDIWGRLNATGSWTWTFVRFSVPVMLTFI